MHAHLALMSTQRLPCLPVEQPCTHNLPTLSQMAQGIYLKSNVCSGRICSERGYVPLEVACATSGLVNECLTNWTPTSPVCVAGILYSGVFCFQVPA